MYQFLGQPNNDNNNENIFLKIFFACIYAYHRPSSRLRCRRRGGRMIQCLMAPHFRILRFRRIFNFFCGHLKSSFLFRCHFESPYMRSLHIFFVEDKLLNKYNFVSNKIKTKLSLTILYISRNSNIIHIGKFSFIIRFYEVIEMSVRIF